DRHLTLEPATGETAVIDQGLPQNPLRLCRIPAQQPRQPAHGPAFARDAAAAMLRQEVAQLLRLRRIEYPATRRSFSSLCDRVDHAMQRADVLLRRSHPLKNVAEVDAHGAALLFRAEEFDALQL